LEAEVSSSVRPWSVKRVFIVYAERLVYQQANEKDNHQAAPPERRVPWATGVSNAGGSNRPGQGNCRHIRPQPFFEKRIGRDPRASKRVFARLSSFFGVIALRAE
jgi:hypothetical protein